MNKNSKYFKKFKKLSVPIGTIPFDQKEKVIRKYLKMKAHHNAARFFKYYEQNHPEFNSLEQYEKRTLLANTIENELFEGIKSEGLEEPVKKPKRDTDSACSSPKLNKKGSTVTFGGIKGRAGYASKRLKSSAIQLSPQNKLSTFNKSLRSLVRKNSIPEYEYKPDKLTLRKMILRALKPIE